MQQIRAIQGPKMKSQLLSIHWLPHDVEKQKKIFYTRYRISIATFQLIGSDKLIKQRKHISLSHITHLYYCVSRICSSYYPLGKRREYGTDLQMK